MRSSRKGHSAGNLPIFTTCQTLSVQHCSKRVPWCCSWTAQRTAAQWHSNSAASAHHGVALRAHGTQQRVLPAAVGHVGIRVAHDEHAQHGRLPAARRRVHRGVAVGVNAVDGVAKGHQRPHVRLVAVAEAVEQRLALRQRLCQQVVDRCTGAPAQLGFRLGNIGGVSDQMACALVFGVQRLCQQVVDRCTGA